MLITSGHFSGGKPCINLDLFGPHGETVTTEAIVDTGFGGFVFLPNSMVRSLRIDINTTMMGNLANGSKQAFPAGFVAAQIGDRRESAIAWVGGGFPMIGMEFLRIFKVSASVSAMDVHLCDAVKFQEFAHSGGMHTPMRRSTLDFDR